MGHRRIAKSIDRLTDAIIGPRMVFVIGPVAEQIEPPKINRAYHRTQRGKVLAMFQLTDSQNCTLTVAFKDKKGNPVSDAHDLTWGVDNSDVLTITPAADNRSCDISAVGPLGSALVSVQDAADQIAGTLEVQVVSGAAVEVTIEPGAPTEQ